MLWLSLSFRTRTLYNVTRCSGPQVVQDLDGPCSRFLLACALEFLGEGEVKVAYLGLVLI